MNSIVDLIQKIISNNPEGIYANLVKEGKMMPGLNPSMQDVITNVQHELQYGDPDQKGAFLVRVFDVPIQTNNLYANDLISLRNSTGKSPAMVLTDQLMVESNSMSSTLYNMGKNAGTVPVINWVLIGLILIGAVVTVRFIARLVGKILQ
jgi:hypothetical protein